MREGPRWWRSLRFRSSRRGLRRARGVIDEAGLDAGVEGELVCGLVDGFGVVEGADGVVDLEVDLGDGLAGAVAFDGEGVGEAGLSLRGGAVDLIVEVFEVGARLIDCFLDVFGAGAGGIVVEGGAVGALGSSSRRPSRGRRLRFPWRRRGNHRGFGRG